MPHLNGQKQRHKYLLVPLNGVLIDVIGAFVGSVIACDDGLSVSNPEPFPLA